MPYSERRRHPRFPFHSSGILVLAGERHCGIVLDISLNGALFRLPASIAANAGQLCRLELLHAAEPGFLFESARIACRRDDLLGLEFAAPGPAARYFLATVVEMNLAVGSLLDRNLPALLATSAG